jgi:hypothetical protein
MGESLFSLDGKAMKAWRLSSNCESRPAWPARVLPTGLFAPKEDPGHQMLRHSSPIDGQGEKIERPDGWFPVFFAEPPDSLRLAHSFDEADLAVGVPGQVEPWRHDGDNFFIKTMNDAPAPFGALSPAFRPAARVCGNAGAYLIYGLSDERRCACDAIAAPPGCGCELRARDAVTLNAKPEPPDRSCVGHGEGSAGTGGRRHYWRPD